MDTFKNFDTIDHCKNIGKLSGCASVITKNVQNFHNRYGVLIRFCWEYLNAFKMPSLFKIEVSTLKFSKAVTYSHYLMVLKKYFSSKLIFKISQR